MDWSAASVYDAMRELEFLTLQDGPYDQRPFKTSFLLDLKQSPFDSGVTAYEHVHAHLKAHVESPFTLIMSHGYYYVDVLPVHAGKGNCALHVAQRWRFALPNVLAAGDSGNDEQMLYGWDGFTC